MARRSKSILPSRQSRITAESGTVCRLIQGVRHAGSGRRVKWIFTNRPSATPPQCVGAAARERCFSQDRPDVSVRSTVEDDTRPLPPIANCPALGLSHGCPSSSLFGEARCAVPGRHQGCGFAAAIHCFCADVPVPAMKPTRGGHRGVSPIFEVKGLRTNTLLAACPTSPKRSSLGIEAKRQRRHRDEKGLLAQTDLSPMQRYRSLAYKDDYGSAPA